TTIAKSSSLLAQPRRIPSTIRLVKHHLHDADRSLCKGCLTIGQVIVPGANQPLGIAQAANRLEAFSERGPPAAEGLRVMRCKILQMNKPQFGRPPNRRQNLGDRRET